MKTPFIVDAHLSFPQNKNGLWEEQYSYLEMHERDSLGFESDRYRRKADKKYITVKKNLSISFYQKVLARVY